MFLFLNGMLYYATLSMQIPCQSLAIDIEEKVRQRIRTVRACVCTVTNDCAALPQAVKMFLALDADSVMNV